MRSEFNKLFKNFFTFFVGDFGTRILSFLMVPYYTNVLSTAQYGEIDLVNSTVNLILPLITLNLSDAVFRYVMDKTSNKKEILGNGLVFSFLGVLLFSTVLLITNGAGSDYALYMYLITVVSIIYGLFINYLKAIGKLKLVAISGFINTFLFIIFNIYFLTNLKLGVTGYFLSTILSSVTICVFLFFSQRLWREVDINIARHDKGLIKKMIRYALPLIPTNLGWWIIMLSNRFIINEMLGVEFTGIYSVANKVPTILQALLTIFMQAWQISATSLFEDNKQKMQHHFEVMLKYYKSGIFIFSSILICFTQVIMKIIAQNDFYQGWVCVPFLLLAISFSSINGLITAIYTSFKENNAQFYTVVAGAIINIILNVVLIKFLGLIGSTIASAISYAIIMYSRLMDTERLLKFNREYNKINLNFFVLIIQAIIFIYLDNLIVKYCMQIICFITIIYLNRNTIKQLGTFAKRRVS